MSAHLCVTLTSFRLKVGDAVHDDVVKEQGFVVDLDVSGEQTAEVLNIPKHGRGREEEEHEHAAKSSSVKLYHDSSCLTTKG